MRNHSFDLPLAIVTSVLLGFGLLMLYSSSFIFAQERTGDGFFFLRKQLGFAGIGLGALAAGLFLPHEKYLRSSFWLLGVAAFLLLLVWVPGVGAKVGGAQRWLRFGGFQIQPSEFAKFAVIVFVARQLTLKGPRIHEFRAGVLSSLLAPLPIFFLLLLQPDFGTVVLLVTVTLCLLYLAGVRLWHLVVTVLGAAGLAATLAVTSPYRMARLLTFWDPWQDPSGKGFQVVQSLLGLFRGRFWGVGLGNSKEKLFFLPEAHNDFIFAVIGEELGLIGTVGVVLLFMLLVYRGLIAAGRQTDRFGALLAAGLTLSLGIQAAVNLSVVMGLLPTKGIPLPFISYGGSSLVASLFFAGILLRLGRRGTP